MKQISTLILFFIITFFISACSDNKPNTPLSVSQAFWKATLNGDTETAKTFLSPQSKANFMITLKNPKDYVTFGEQRINTSHAQIATQLVRHNKELKKIISMETILVLDNGQWLVDFDKTRASVPDIELKSVIERLSNNMKEALDKGIKVMGDSVKKELKQLDHSIQDAINDLNRQIEKQQKQNQKEQKPQEHSTTTI